MINKFYTDFDLERIKPGKGDEYRTPFQVDRDRIIHSSEFRRLQSKTQVFLPGEYDYYRTRLTHSIEVAQIGRSICNFIRVKNPAIFSDDCFVDPDLVEFACLAHDLGNPPFGHPCEKQINQLMKKYGGYEGNAQTLRLITETFYKEGESKRGMNPCRATIDSVLKYKALFSQFEDPEHHFIYDEQEKFIRFVFNNQKDVLPGDPDQANNFRSIECQIMDYADDAAYSVNDLADSISGRFITVEKLEKWAENNLNWNERNNFGLVENMIKSIKDGNYKRNFSAEIGELISAVKVVANPNKPELPSNRYNYNITTAEEIKNKIKLYKKISTDLVFRSPQLHQVEFKGNYIITRILKIMFENYVTNIKPEKLLPEFTDKMLRLESSERVRARLVCDYISGMTDSYALRIYKRLFDPDYSSLGDIV